MIFFSVSSLIRRKIRSASVSLLIKLTNGKGIKFKFPKRLLRVVVRLGKTVPTYEELMRRIERLERRVAQLTRREPVSPEEVLKARLGALRIYERDDERGVYLIQSVNPYTPFCVKVRRKTGFEEYCYGELKAARKAFEYYTKV